MATMKSLMKNNRLLILGASESVSTTGNWITMMAVYAMLVFRGNGSVAESGGVYLAGLVPTLLFSPAAGWLCDRFDRRRLMIASELISGLVISGLFFARQPALIYILLAAQAISISIMSPARQAVVPQVVAKEDLTRVNAFLGQLSGIVKIAAPSLAGLVLIVLNPHQAILLDVVSFVLSALILSRLPSLPPQPAAQSRSGERTGSGWSVLGSISGLQLLFVTTFLTIAVITGFDVLSPVFTRDILRGSESLFGIIISLVGFGTLGATLYLMLRRGHPSPWRDITAGLILLAMIPGLFALAAQISDLSQARAFTLVGAIAGGVGTGLLTIQSGTLLQLLSPANLLGRMGGLFQTTMVAGQLVGILVTPFLVPGILPLAPFFALMAVGLLAVTVFVAVVSGRNHFLPVGFLDRA